MFESMGRPSATQASASSSPEPKPSKSSRESKPSMNSNSRKRDPSESPPRSSHKHKSSSSSSGKWGSGDRHKPSPSEGKSPTDRGCEKGRATDRDRDSVIERETERQRLREKAIDKDVARRYSGAPPRPPSRNHSISRTRSLSKTNDFHVDITKKSLEEKITKTTPLPYHPLTCDPIPYGIPPNTDADVFTAGRNRSGSPTAWRNDAHHRVRDETRRPYVNRPQTHRMTDGRVIRGIPNLRKTCPPFLLRVFYNLDSMHTIDDFNVNGQEPTDHELQVYAWKDMRLRELVYLIKDVCWEARDRDAVWTFRVVYPDRSGKNVIAESHDIHSTRFSYSDSTTLEQLKFHIGDFIDLSIYRQQLVEAAAPGSCDKR